LKKRPGLVGEDVDVFPGLFHRAHDAQRRAVSRRGQRARVAVRHNMQGVAEQLGPEFSELPVRGDILMINFDRFGL
jgi:hypothetical protein